MITKEVAAALNKQINNEFWSAYLYLSMSMYFAHKSYDGIAHWFHVQYKEELDHAEILMNYLIEQDAKVELAPVGAVDTEWETLKTAFESTLAHEQSVSAHFNHLYAIASEHHDYATMTMLQWFISEQVEEEATARNYIDNLTKIGDNGYGLYMFDKELGSRSYNTPAPLANKG